MFTQKMKNKALLFSTLILTSFFTSSFFLQPVLAENEEIIPNEEFHINLDKETIAKGYTVAGFSDKIKLSLVPEILTESTDVDMLVLNEKLDTPWQLNKISQTYQFEFKNKAAYDNHKPFYIQISYEEDDNNLKRVYFFDKNLNGWRPLPTRDFPKDKFVRSLIHLPYARIAVFSFPDILTTGRASWYAHKGGNFAASPDFPAGSVLRVYNQDNGKYVDVTVNDWGPERDKHPDRVVDLDKVAFSKIASTGAGVIDVYVEPLMIMPDADGKELGFDKDGLSSNFNISAKAAIAVNEDTGKIIWEKNASSSMPLASLTKLIAAKVFLDTNPDLTDVIAYSKKDEEYNYAYCKPWESAKIKLAEGDELTYENVIYGSLVGSANNTIETMVRASGLSRADFIAKMNESVKEWGASSTHFIEPTGLSPENVSSVADYAIILSEVLSNPIIQKASVMSRYVFSTINTEEEHRITNTNKIIQTRDFTFTGSKTGYLDEAGYCLATRVLHGAKNLIVITFGVATRDKSFSETVDLIKYAILNT